jgi:hypothetical protein
MTTRWGVIASRQDRREPLEHKRRRDRRRHDGGRQHEEHRDEQQLRRHRERAADLELQPTQRGGRDDEQHEVERVDMPAGAERQQEPGACQEQRGHERLSRELAASQRLQAARARLLGLCEGRRHFSLRV